MKKFTSLVLTFATVQMLAQTGPGGVGDATTNVLWLDASKLTLNNNDPVSSWTDVSGNSNNAVQSNGTNQPIYLSTGFNGMPALSFDGVDDYLDLTTHISSPAQSVFAVNQFGTPNGWTFLYMADQCDIQSNDGYNFGYRANGTFVSAGSYSVNNKKIISILVDNNASTLQTGHNNTYLNQTYPGIISKSRSIIGANYYSGAYHQFHSGIVPEIIVFNYRVNNAQKIIINNYLAAKYGLTIYNDFYGLESTHPNEVAGIGSWSGDTHTDARGTSDIEVSNPNALDPGDFLMWGHDGNNYSLDYDMPASLSGARWQKTWRLDNKNYTGTYDVRVYIGSNTIGSDDSQYYLVYDSDDGIFSNGGSGEFGPGSYDAITNSVLFSGVSIPDNAWFTLANKSVSIRSVATGNWNSASTWSCSCVPDSTVNVIISSGHNVSVASYSSVNSIEIEANGTLTLSNSNTLSIKGNLTNYGSFVANQGTLLFSGNNAQYITNNSSVLNFDLYNYRQTNTNRVYLNKGNLRIFNNLYTSGQLLNVGPNYVVLICGATSTSYISPISISNPFSGNFRLIRYISARNAAWSNIASATASGTFAQLDNKLYFSGIGGADGNAIHNGEIFYSAYAFNAATQAYDTVKSTSRVLNAGEGFEIWLADDESTYNGGSYYVNGIPNTGSIDANSYLPSLSGEWALVGNPYMSWVDWSQVNKVNLDNTVWIYDAATANYVSYSNPQIPPMQGFWVQATGNSPSLTFTESSKVASNSSTFYRIEQEPDFSITLKEPSTGYAQKTVIILDKTATLDYDAGKDVTLLRSPNKKAPTLTSVSGGKKLMRNYIPIKANEIEIPLFVSVKNNELYHFSISNISKLNEFNTVSLIDIFSHKIYNLKQTNEIDVFLNEGDYDGRFILRFSNNLSQKFGYSKNNNVYITNGNIKLVLDASENELITVQLYNITGQLIKEEEGLTAGIHRLETTNSLSKGTYIVRLLYNTGHIETIKLNIQ